jgi:hypothetical protein
MVTTREDSPRTALVMLDEAAHAARAGFACMFSSADEYEAALIAERRTQGHYSVRSTSKFWPIALAIGCGLIIVGAALLMV